MTGLFSIFTDRPILRRSLMGVGGVLVVLVLLLIILRILLASPPGRAFVEARVEALSISGQSIVMDGLEGDLLGTFSIASLIVSDDDGEWLSAQNLELSWSPWSLWGRHLDIDLVSADLISVDRQPVLQSSSASSSGGSSPIKRYSVEDLSIRTIQVDEGLIGREETFSLRADLDTSLDAGGASLELTPTVDTGDKVSGAFNWSKAGGIEGSLDATGPADGLLHELLMINQAGPVQLEASAGGKADEWGANLSLTVDGEAVTRLEWAGSDTSGAGEGQIIPSAFRPLTAEADRLGGPVDILATYQPQTREIDVELTSPNLTLQAIGALPDETASIINISAQSGAPTQLLQIDGLTAQSVRIKGPVTLDGDRIGFSGDITTAGLKYDSYGAQSLSVKVDADYNTEAASITSRFTAAGRGLSGVPEAARDVVGRSLDVSGAANLDVDALRVTLPDVRLKLASGDVSAKGQIDLQPLRFDLTGGLRLSKPIYDVTPQNVRWSAKGPLEALAVGVDGSVDAGQIDVRFEPWLGEPVTLSARALIGENGRVDVSRLQARNGAIDLSATGLVSADQLDADLALTLAGGTVSAIDMSELRLVGEVTGSPDAPRFNLQAKTNQVIASGETVRDLALAVNGSFTSGRLDVATTGSALYREEPADLTGKITLEGEAWQLEDLSANWSDFDMSGDLSGRGSDLASLTGDLTLDGRLPMLATGGLVSGRLDVEGDTPVARLNISDVAFGDQTIDTLDLTGRVSDGLARIDASLAGETLISGIRHPYQFKADGSLDPATQSASLMLDGTVSDVPLKTDGPIEASFADGRYTAIGTLLAFDGSADFDLEKTGESLSLTIDASQISLRNISRLADVPELRGLASLDLNIQSEGERLIGSATGNVTDLSRVGIDEDGTFQLSYGIDLLDEKLDATADLKGPAGRDLLKVTSSVPVISSLAVPFIQFEEDTAITAQLEGAGSLDTLWQLLGVEEIDAAGDYRFDISLEQTAEGVAPSGTVVLTGARIEDRIAGLRLENINLDTVIDPEGVAVRSLTANGTKGGTLTGSGRYDFDGGAGVDVTLDKLQAFRRSDVQGTVTGTMKVTRGERITRLGGDLTIDRLDVDITKLPKGGYTTLDVKFPDDPAAQGEVAEASPIELDLQVGAPRRIFVEGSGLRMEWGFDTRITGNASAPRVIGDARVIRGDVDLVGRNFQFNDSRILFNGPPEDAILNIQAIREQDEFTAEVTVEGTASAPEISLSSTPELPEDEVLSRVLFGRSPTELSAFEAAQLALAVASIGRGNFNMVGAVGDTLGVDRLDFGLSDSGVPSIGAGKYITPDLYLELRSTPRGNAGVNLEWTPRRNLEVSTELESNDAPRFGIQWKRDFEFGRDKTKDEDGTSETTTPGEKDSE